MRIITENAVAASGVNPERAVVGAQISHDEEMFGRAFDGRVMRRFFAFVWPYRTTLVLALLTVLVFVGTQLSIPLIILYAIDHTLSPADIAATTLGSVVMVFASVILLNYLANYLQEILVGRVAENVIIDLRRAMFSHLQGVALSFMDKTEVGRVMSRLQSDTGTLQEYLESSVFAIGDMVLLLGITVTLLVLDLSLIHI